MARSLGCTLDELGERMSSAEYSLRLYHRDPWGDRTVAMLVAQLLALTFNIHRKKDAQPMSVDDLLPSRRLAPEASAPATMADVQQFMSELGF